MLPTTKKCNSPKELLSLPLIELRCDVLESAVDAGNDYCNRKEIANEKTKPFLLLDTQNKIKLPHYAQHWELPYETSGGIVIKYSHKPSQAIVIT